MSKSLKRSLLVIVIWLLILGGGWFGLRYVHRQSIDHQVAELEASVRFGHSGETDEIAEVLPMETLAGYTDRYANASAGYYAAKLTGSELVTYRSVLYAMDHSYDYVELPAGIITADRVLQCVSFASLDHALLEENSVVDLGSATLVVGDRELKRHYLKFSGFTAERLAKKEQAYAAAQKIVAELPAGTGEETARRLFDWVAEHIAYTQAEDYNNSDPHYLYDAFMNSSSNCDGISNAYTLLMNLAGMECFNVIDDPAEGEEGHTWNILKLNGVYFQADSTAEAGLYALVGQSCGISFARSAEAIGNGPYHPWLAEAAPACGDTSRDAVGMDVYFKSREPGNAEKRALRNAVEELEYGAKIRIFCCAEFPLITEQQRLELVKEWIRPCYVDLRLYTAGDRYCILCRDQ
ncbi:MAG: hypothetical protein IJ043_09240 [Clostridia bacterium]|nr:hypothetical protein [Clostridia bacterium]